MLSITHLAFEVSITIGQRVSLSEMMMAMDANDLSQVTEGRV